MFISGYEAQENNEKEKDGKKNAICIHPFKFQQKSHLLGTMQDIKEVDRYRIY